METNHKPVIIIGAGYAGLSLALFLKKAGITSTVFEAYPNAKNIGGGIGLAPNGINVLQELGLSKQVINAGKIVDYNNFRNYKGKFLARIKLNAIKKFGQPFVMIPRAALQQILYQEVFEQGIEVNFQKRLKDINESTEGITAIFDDESSFEGALIIGADGIHSASRKIIFNDAFPEEYTGFYGAGGFVQKSTIEQYLGQYDHDALNLSFGLSGFFGFNFQTTDELMWWCSVELAEQDAKQTLMKLSSGALKNKLAADYKDFYSPVPQLVANSDHIIKTVMYDMPSLPKWYQDKTILIGDAAHAVSPTSGLGASLALEDAMLLAKLLRKHTITEHSKAFFDFQSIRKPRTEKVRADANKHNTDKKVHSPASAWIRDTIMSLFLKLFGLGAVDWKYSYKIEWND
ncbi:2-polyprenyl-6-methoxyphenol hydroxylase [Mucilaginibacter lappiensis]|uniref:2-polyprenyl-6-methoxyphenol hydroxylase-like FAD-dependent oxidoreductase n=1 Tax=Mucilaginibacter lappiensis TaxID=354630 RepID=A0ABR6PJ78_9SPHI|nr:NAD(P)/FAD-dependent oxidoreductase [Mucilaginibacter lappiensis]MBB6109826.1 2-polyprenyl-6-methoxyphenol hydroxylase-like FAD-dependent oxidoreductase [Mucilaginibacter lappiensis]SIR16912.1 2-polyprenyl-6-methoxyphenol hydroxylase [Mucilaginibacter lappiensis]